MAKKTAKYDINYHKDTNDCFSGSVAMKLADGHYFVLSMACSPLAKVRTGKSEINDYFEKRIPEFMKEYPGSVPITWDEYIEKTKN